MPPAGPPRRQPAAPRGLLVLAGLGVAAVLLVIACAGVGSLGFAVYHYLAASRKGAAPEGPYARRAAEAGGGAVGDPTPPPVARPATPEPAAPAPASKAGAPRAADSPPVKPGDLLPDQPPEGWKEYIPPSKAFSVWLPSAGRRTERTREFPFRGVRCRVSLVEVETREKVILWASQVGLPVRPGERVDPIEAIEVFRDVFLKEVGGTVADQSEIQLGKMGGREYLIDTANGGRARLRVYATGPNAARVYQISLTGTKDDVEGEAAKLFFASYKHQGMVGDDLKKRAQDPATK